MLKDRRFKLPDEFIHMPVRQSHTQDTVYQQSNYERCDIWDCQMLLSVITTSQALFQYFSNWWIKYNVWECVMWRDVIG